jgi:septation ring formation regulator EzrA
MVLQSYKKLLAMGKEAIEAAKIPSRAAQTQKQGELEVLKLEEKIATLSAELEEAQMEYPLNWSALIDKTDQLALIERRHKKLGEALSQLFPENDE